MADPELIDAPVVPDEPLALETPLALEADPELADTVPDEDPLTLVADPELADTVPEDDPLTLVAEPLEEEPPKGRLPVSLYRNRRVVQMLWIRVLNTSIVEIWQSQNTNVFYSKNS